MISKVNCTSSAAYAELFASSLIFSILGLMDRYYSQAVNTHVFTISGQHVGKITEVVINIETGTIVGFLLGSKGNHVIAPNDVILWDQHIIIHDIDDILETEEIIKVKKALEKNIPIIHNSVVTKSGVYLGKVYDFAINPKLFVMTKIIVAKSLLGLFPYDEKIIAHQDILEIKKDTIIVKDPYRTELAKEKSDEEKANLQIDIAPTTFSDLTDQ